MTAQTRYIGVIRMNEVVIVQRGLLASNKEDAESVLVKQARNAYGTKFKIDSIVIIPVRTVTICKLDHAFGLAPELVETLTSGNTTLGDDTVIIAEGAVVYKLVVNVEDITLLVEMAANDPADAFLEMLSQLKRNEDYQTWERKGLLQRESFRFGEVQPVWLEHGDEEYTWSHVLDIIDAGCQSDDEFPVCIEKKNGQIMFSKKPKLSNENVAEPRTKKQKTAHA